MHVGRGNAFLAKRFCVHTGITPLLVTISRTGDAAGGGPGRSIRTGGPPYSWRKITSWTGDCGELPKMTALPWLCGKREDSPEKFLSGDSYDLILMDMQMPEMDGYQTAEAIRTDISGQPTSPSFHDGWCVPWDVVRAYAAGMNDTWPKPINPALIRCWPGR